MNSIFFSGGVTLFLFPFQSLCTKCVQLTFWSFPFIKKWRNEKSAGEKIKSFRKCHEIWFCQMKRFFTFFNKKILNELRVNKTCDLEWVWDHHMQSLGAPSDAFLSMHLPSVTYIKKQSKSVQRTLKRIVQPIEWILHLFMRLLFLNNAFMCKNKLIAIIIVHCSNSSCKLIIRVWF